MFENADYQQNIFVYYCFFTTLFSLVKTTSFPDTELTEDITQNIVGRDLSRNFT